MPIEPCPKMLRWTSSVIPSYRLDQGLDPVFEVSTSRRDLTFFFMFWLKVKSSFANVDE